MCFYWTINIIMQDFPKFSKMFPVESDLNEEEWEKSGRYSSYTLYVYKFYHNIYIYIYIHFQISLEYIFSDAWNYSQRWYMYFTLIDISRFVVEHTIIWKRHSKHTNWNCSFTVFISWHYSNIKSIPKAMNF